MFSGTVLARSPSVGGTNDCIEHLCCAVSLTSVFCAAFEAVGQRHVRSHARYRVCGMSLNDFSSVDHEGC
eukprot:m.473932 g.473932  ORF g.473932 m.473932 type:complete len:70 (+) comp21670_c2_seq2:22-231(+)